MPEENTNLKIWSGISVDKFAENVFKLVDGILNKNLETFVRFENIEKIEKNCKIYKIWYFPYIVKYCIIQNS